MTRPGWKILRYPLNTANAPAIIAFEESKRSNIWFPEFPLSTLLATGRLYHFSYGVFDRFLAGRPVSVQQLWEGVPQPPFKLKYQQSSQVPMTGIVPDVVEIGRQASIASGR
jgi:hypothetical protein